MKKASTTTLILLALVIVAINYAAWMQEIAFVTFSFVTTTAIFVNWPLTYYMAVKYAHKNLQIMPHIVSVVIIICYPIGIFFFSQFSPEVNQTDLMIGLAYVLSIITLMLNTLTFSLSHILKEK